MKRRGVYEAECLASSRRIATSPLIPLTFQLQGWNSGEDGLPSAAHSSRAGTSGRPSTSRYNAGWPQPMLEAPADEAGSALQTSRLVIWEIACSVHAFSFRIL